MSKGFETTNLHGIVRLLVEDDKLTLVMTYDNGDKFRKIIPLPHTSPPHIRAGWTFLDSVLS